MMRRIRALQYILKQSMINLAKNWYMLLASVFVLFTALYIMGCLGLTSVNIRHILEEQGNRPEVEVICRETVSDEASLDIAKIILEDPRIRSYARVSRAENLERMKKLMAGYEDLFDTYTDEDSSFLYVSFDIELKDADDLESFAEDMMRIDGVAEVEDNRSIHTYFNNISVWVRTGTYAAMVVLGFLSVLLMLNTIRLTVFARQKELRIMKYVGASKAYMRGPFVAEGLVIGLLGAILTFFAVRGTYAYLYRRLAEAGAEVRKIIVMIPFASLDMQLLGAFLLGGIATGLLASLLTVKKYIKV